jgi:type IV fimbrial biogenesis protein FimT
LYYFCARSIPGVKSNPPLLNSGCDRARRRAAGFSAIELLVVLAVIAILAALALPSFKTVVTRYRVRNAVADLRATIYYARSEAFRRGGGVTLRKATAAGCAAPKAKQWRCGWTVFADDNLDGKADPGEQVLQSTAAPDGVDVEFTADLSYLKLNRWGESDFGAFGIMVGPAGSADAAEATTLCMSAGGRLKTLTGARGCS